MLSLIFLMIQENILAGIFIALESVLIFNIIAFLTLVGYRKLKGIERDEYRLRFFQRESVAAIVLILELIVVYPFVVYIIAEFRIDEFASLSYRNVSLFL